MTVDIGLALETNQRLNTEKSQWKLHWQLVHEFFLQRKADFTTSRQDGAFINSDIWTAMPAKAAETCASALLGLVWPDNRSFEVVPFGEEIKDDEEVKAWFKYCTSQMQNDMDDPAAGLALALDEFMLDYVVSGTPALHTEEGDKSTYRFDAWNVKQFSIDEGPDGYVDTFYMEREYTVRQAVKKFTLAKLAPQTQKLWNAKKFMEKIKLLHIIQPREVAPEKGSGPQNMPFASIYIESEARHLVKESGYHELPTFAARYSKRIGEKYGRSPAMRALPDVQELNALWEIITLGAEKTFDPPLAVYDDGTFGAGTIDTSAGAINVLNVMGKLNATRKPIEELFTVGSLNEIAKLLEMLVEAVNDHFMIDRLIDQDNKTQMTAREFLGRQAARQISLRSVISRLLAELFDRLIERCFNIGLRKGRFGYAAGSPEMIAAQAAHSGATIRTIPDKIVAVQGKQGRIYQIKYMTPAARERRAEEATGILNWMQFIGEAAAQDQTARDIPNLPRTARVLADIWNVPEECKNTPDEIKALQQSKVQAATQQQGLEQMTQGAEIAKTLAEAQSAQNAGQPTVR